MTDDRQKNPTTIGERPGVSANDRPTESPPFDLQALARATAFSKPPKDEPLRTGASCTGSAPAQAPPPVRGEEITLTDEVELERARVASVFGREGLRLPATTSVLSMANAAARSSPAGPASTPPNRVPAATDAKPAVFGGALSGGTPEITQRIIDDPGAEMHERFSLGDYTGALELAELILADDPKNLDAAECSENCRTVLENMYSARLGPPGSVPFVVVPNAHMRWLSMDHRAGFVLSLIDGKSTLDTILDLCGMPRLDALHILHDLVEQKVVAVK